MSTQVQYRRGTEAQNNAFTGALAEITVDTTNWALRVHDGVTAGGTATVSANSSALLQTGNILPQANTTYNLGSNTKMWNALYVSGNTIYLGNLQLKEASANTFAVFTADGTTQANIDVGNIDVSSIVQGTSTIGISGTNGNGYFTIGGTANVLVVANTGTITTGLASVTGNVIGGNITTAGLLSAAGNITGNYFLGNGSQLTGIDATSIQNGTANVRTFLNGNVSVSASGTGNVIVVTDGGQITTGFVSATGNITGGNILSGGQISTTGNVTGANVNTSVIVGTNVTISSTGNIVLSATGNINANNEYINNVPTPVQDGDAANKLYVDNFVSGLNIHDAANAATPTTLATISSGTITYNNGTDGVGATLTTTGTFNLIDTVNVQTAGTRILVLNEANAVTNGVYVWSNATVLTRATDYDTVPEVEAGDFIFVTAGNVYGNTGWVQTSTVANIGLAGNNITFTQFSGSGTYNAGTGLTLTGTTFSVNASQTQITAVGTLGSLSVTGNIEGGNLRTAGLVSATGDITGGNILTAGIVSATGNITGNYFLGNGSQLTGIDATSIQSGTSNVRVQSSGGNVSVGVGGSAIVRFTTAGIVNDMGNGVGNIGNTTGYFNTIFAKATSAQYADLAEMYEADGPVEPGTVVAFGGSKEVTICEQDGSRRVAGVVSTNPSYVMNAGLAGDNVIAVALMGRVPTRVVGAVTKGDMMVAAGNGRARSEANPKPGQILGKALADFDGTEGVIEIVVGRI